MDTMTIRKTLLNTDMTPPTIQKSAAVMLSHYDRMPSLAIDEWRQCLTTCQPSQLLPLLYVANEVIQTSKRNRGPKFLEAFSPVMGSSLRLICQRNPDVVDQVRRVVKIWGDRRIYSVRYVTDVLSGVEQYRTASSSAGGGHHHHIHDGGGRGRGAGATGGGGNRRSQQHSRRVSSSTSREQQPLSSASSVEQGIANHHHRVGSNNSHLHSAHRGDAATGLTVDNANTSTQGGHSSHIADDDDANHKSEGRRLSSSPHGVELPSPPSPSNSSYMLIDEDGTDFSKESPGESLLNIDVLGLPTSSTTAADLEMTSSPAMFLPSTSRDSPTTRQDGSSSSLKRRRHRQRGSMSRDDGSNRSLGSEQQQQQGATTTTTTEGTPKKKITKKRSLLDVLDDIDSFYGQFQLFQGVISEIPEEYFTADQTTVETMVGDELSTMYSKVVETEHKLVQRRRKLYEIAQNLHELEQSLIKFIPSLRNSAAQDAVDLHMCDELERKLKLINTLHGVAKTARDKKEADEALRRAKEERVRRKREQEEETKRDLEETLTPAEAQPGMVWNPNTKEYQQVLDQTMESWRD